ncbi:MAG TPA: IPT/TIG domain-containing protein [Thermoanaerobaculia bacterium]
MRKRVAVVVAVLLSLAGAAFAQNSNDPVISSFEPRVMIAGLGGGQVTVTGLNFIAGSQVRVNGGFRDTTRISNTQLRFTLSASETSSARTLRITVVNNNGISQEATFQVLPNEPTITGIDPPAVPVRSPDTTIRVTGVNFGPGAVVLFDNTALATTYVDHTIVDAVIPADRLRFAASIAIRVRNANNRTSSPVALTVSNQPLMPVLTALDPDRVQEDAASFTMRLIGQNFDEDSRVYLNATEARPVTFVSSQELRVQVLANLLNVPGAVAVTVLNPGNQRSNALSLTIEGRNVPIIESLTPHAVRAGQGAVTVTVNGQRFNSSSQVELDGNRRTTTFVSSARLRFTLAASELNVPGERAVTVVNSTGGGGTSNAEPLYITAADAPIVNSTIPGSLPVNSPELNVIVVGAEFTNRDVVFVNGVPRQTTFESATRLGVALLPLDVANAGILLITVENAEGDRSAPVELPVAANQLPVIESFSPATGDAGAQSLSLIINGRNFSTSSIVRFRGQIVPLTQFINDRQIVAELTAAMLATPGVAEVTVANPGGLVSAPEYFELIGNVPVITAIDPTAIAAGTLGASINVSGTGFSSASIISIDGQPLETTYNTGSGTLSATLTSADLASPRAAAITVTERGLVSAAGTLQIVRPTITGLDPSSVRAGSAGFTMTITGTGFLPTSIVEFLGERVTQYISPTELRATIPALVLTQPGEFAVTVRNGTSAQSIPVFFQILGLGEPLVTDVTPSGLLVGGTETQIVVRGQNFTGDARVRINGQERPTIFVSTTELRATVLASDLATARTLTVTVANGSGAPSAGFNVSVTEPGRGRRRAARP